MRRKTGQAQKEKKNTQKKKLERFDDVFDYVGHFGKYSCFMYCIISFADATTASHMLLSVFILPLVKHRCRVPSVKNDTFGISGYETLFNQTFICDVGDSTCQKAECEFYETPGSNHTVDCDEWVYDHSIFTNTVTEQFSLVCDRKVMRSHVQMIFMGGLLLGSLFFGQLSDLFGRRTVQIVSYSLQVTSGIAIIFSPNVWVFAVLRFVNGLGNAGIITGKFVHAMECVGSGWRPFCGVASGFWWVGGASLLTFFSYFIRDWRYLQLAATLPWVFVLAAHIFILPESPRWLITKAKFGRATKALKKFATWSKVPPLSRQEVESLRVDEQKASSILSVFTSRIFTIRAFIVWYAWFVNSFVYYGITLNSGSFSGNIFLNFFLNTIVEIPSYGLSPAMCRYLGRRATMSLMMTVGGLSCTATIFISLYGDVENSTAWFWGMMTLVLVGKFCITATFQVVFLYTVELFPTSVRSSTVGVGSMAARVGGMVAPYVADLSLYIKTPLHESLSQVVFGGFSILAGLLFLLLPETRHVTQLPDTLKEAEQLYSSRKGDIKLQDLGTANEKKGQDNPALDPDTAI